MSQQVSDSLSNTNEQIEQAAKAIGKSKLHRNVFETIYNGKQRIKTVGEIANRTNLTRKQVLISGKRLDGRQIVDQCKHNGDTAYRKIDFFYAHKRQILKLAGNPRELARLPTKRKIVVKLPKSISVPSKGAKVKRITVDDVMSFSKVRRFEVDGTLPSTVSEEVFKKGVEKIVKEIGGKKDWGGEKNDFFTTRVRLKAARVNAAFAFKGPGKKAKTLVPGMMGKNGDQIQRLFQTDAQVFFVQYWREISESILEQMRTFAIVKSIADGNCVYYGVIDGADSLRLYRAYPRAFKGRARKRNGE